jgi:hypothetical protein
MTYCLHREHSLKPLATELVKKQIQKAIKDSITTGMEYVDGQLVGVRDYMVPYRSRCLPRRMTNHPLSLPPPGFSTHGKVVHNKQNFILDTGHPTGWVNHTTEHEDTA